MYTQCPKCLTYFQVSADHLKVAQGNVRCGQCRNVFSALGNLTELPPQPNQEPGSENHTKSNAANSSQQSNLSDAIAAIQALNQSSTKLQILSDNRAPYAAHHLGGDTSLEQDTPTMNDSSSTARKLLQPDPDEVIEHIPELVNDDAADDLNEFNFDEALKAVDEIGINNETVEILDDSPIRYGADNGEDITPTIDGSHLVEDYSSAQEPFIGNTPETPLVAKTHDQQPHIAPPEDTTKKTIEIEEISITTSEAIDEPVVTHDNENNNETLAQTINKITLPDSDVSAEASAKTPIKGPAKAPPEADKPIVNEEKVKQHPVESIKNLPAIPKQLIDDFRQDHHMLISNYRSIITWGVSSLLLMFVFLGQTIYFKHNELGQISQLRPWIEFFCRHANCELSMQADITQLELLGQDIRSHPTTSQALLVSATIINNAPYVQPYPGLQLNFSDINGEKVAVRNFEPKDYVANSADANKGMEPNTPFQIELEIIDPGKTAINFEFDFFSM